MKRNLFIFIILIFSSSIQAQNIINNKRICLYIPSSAIDSLLQNIREIDTLKNADFVITIVNDPYNKLLKILHIQKKGIRFEYNPASLPFPICGYFNTKNVIVFIQGYKKNVDYFFTATNKSKEFHFIIPPTSPTYKIDIKIYSNIFIYNDGIFSYGFKSAH